MHFLVSIDTEPRFLQYVAVSLVPNKQCGCPLCDYPNLITPNMLCANGEQEQNSNLWEMKASSRNLREMKTSSRNLREIFPKSSFQNLREIVILERWKQVPEILERCKQVLKIACKSDFRSFKLCKRVTNLALPYNFFLKLLQLYKNYVNYFKNW